MSRRVVVLGATGSIGTQAFDVIQAHRDNFEVTGLAVGRDIDGVVAQADALGVKDIAVADESQADALRAARSDLTVHGGHAGVVELAAKDADLVLNGITGAVGLEPTLAALANHTPVALANKESLIVGGDLVVRAAERAGGREAFLIPVDSEHSALAQCLRSGRRAELKRLVLTASGGPFRGRSRESLAEVTAAEALDHPTWSMGPVVTTNSASLMNKGLELIEAHELFDVAWDDLDVVVHPQSVVHSMAEFVDGSTIAQLSPPDMRLPIQLALSWPHRLDHAFRACDWTQASQLTFEPVDRETFDALDLAEAAGRKRGTYPAVLNAANEIAVDAFLRDALRFPDITATVAQTLDAWDAAAPSSPRELADVLAADEWARVHARRLVDQRSI